MTQRFSWMHPDLEIKEVPAKGRGVFASKDIEKGEVIIVTGGNILDKKAQNEYGAFCAFYNMDISEEFCFAPYTEEEVLKMPQCLINHSCEPNVGFASELMMVTMRKINAGEEIVYDYAFVMYGNDRNRIQFTLDCCCGAPTCRLHITEFDWKLPQLHKYTEYFQPFLQKHIRALKQETETHEPGAVPSNWLSDTFSKFFFQKKKNRGTME